MKFKPKIVNYHLRNCLSIIFHEYCHYLMARILGIEIIAVWVEPKVYKNKETGKATLVFYGCVKSSATTKKLDLIKCILVAYAPRLSYYIFLILILISVIIGQYLFYMLICAITVYLANAFELSGADKAIIKTQKQLFFNK